MQRVLMMQLGVFDHENRSDRLARVEGLMEKIAVGNEKPVMIMLPEIWTTGFFNFERYALESESLEGETFSRLAPWAEKIGCYILGGSVVEKDGEDLYNTSLIIGPGGLLAGSYRKIHLFGYQSQESGILTAGSEVYVLKTDYGHWGFSTCYDLRFPELYRCMLDAGADTFFIVAAWPLARLDHWVLFNRVRALENLSYLISCNCAGSLKGQRFAGNSMAVDPWGEIKAAAGEDEEILSVEINRNTLAEIRADFPALQDRCVFSGEIDNS